MPLNLTLANDPRPSSLHGCWCPENTAFEVGMVGMESQLLATGGAAVKCSKGHHVREVT